MKKVELRKILMGLAVASIISLAGCTTAPKEFHEGLAAVEKNGKWGYTDTLNNIVIPFQYDSAGYFTNGMAIVKSNNKIGTIDKSGNPLLKIKYDHIGHFIDSVAIVGNEGKYGFIDITGKEIVPLLYNEIKPFENGLATAIQDGDTVYVDKNGIENQLVGTWRFNKLLMNTVSKGVFEFHNTVGFEAADPNTASYMTIERNGDFKSNFSLSDDERFFGKALIFDKNTKWKSTKSKLENGIYTCDMELLDEGDGLLYQINIKDKNVITLLVLETVYVPSKSTELGTTKGGTIEAKYEITFKR